MEIWREPEISSLAWIAEIEEKNRLYLYQSMTDNVRFVMVCEKFNLFTHL